MTYVSIWMILVYLVVAASGADVDKARAPSGAEIMPQNCLAFLEARPVPKWDDAMQSLGNEKMATQLRQMRDGMLKELARELDRQPQEFEELFDRIDSACFGMWEMARQGPKFALVITFEDAESAARLSEMFGKKAVKTVSRPWGTQHAYAEGLFVGHAKNRIILAPGIEGMENEPLNAVGSLIMTPGGGLADNPEFRAVRQRVPTDRPVLGYLNAPRLLQQIRSGVPEGGSGQLAMIERAFDLDNVGGALLAVTRVEDLILGDLVVDAPGNRVYALVKGPPRELHEAMSYCPAGCRLAAVCNVPQVTNRWDRIDSYIGSLAQEEWTEAKQEMKEEMGIDLNAEFMQRLRGDGGMFLAGDKPAYGDESLGLLTGFKSGESARDVVEEWKRTYWPHATFQEKTVDSTTLSWTEARGRLAYAVHNGMLVFGPFPDPIEASLRDKGARSSLPSGGLPAQLLDVLPRTASGMAVANVTKLSGGEFKMLPGAQGAEKDVWGAMALRLPDPGPHAQFLLQMPATE